MRNIVFLCFLTSTLIFNIHAETVYLTCMGKDTLEVESDSKIGSLRPSVESFMSFRWIQLDKQNKSILLALIHCFFGWLYVIYYYIGKRQDEN